MSFQQIIIVGNLGRDPEMRYTPSGAPVTTFSVASTRRWKGQDGQQQEKTVWFRITAWNKLAEFSSQYLVKGQSVLVVGEMEEPRVWQDKDGNHRSSLEVTARSIQFNGPRPDGAGGPSGDSYESGEYSGGQGGGYSNSGGGNRAASSGPAPARGSGSGGGPRNDPDRQEPEDIPF